LKQLKARRGPILIYGIGGFGKKTDPYIVKNGKPKPSLHKFLCIALKVRRSLWRVVFECRRDYRNASYGKAGILDLCARFDPPFE